MVQQASIIKPFTVLSRARPRRIAFLIDPNNCPPELLDSLFESNYNLWGGRYNSIIPVVAGTITDSYWQLLRFADPDVIYSYCDIPGDLIQNLDRELCPMKMERHLNLGQAKKPPHYYPSLCRDQVEISALLPLVLKREGDGFRTPKLLTSAAKENWQHRRLTLRNFGLIKEKMVQRPYPKDQEKITIQDDWTEEKLYEELASESCPIVFPFQASEAFSDIPEADNNYQYEYCIVIGDDVQDWIYFWNRVFLLSGYRRSRWHSLCISPQSLERQSKREALKKFLKSFAWRSGSSPDKLDLVSFSLTTKDLNKIGRELLHGVDVIPHVKHLKSNEFCPISKEYRNFPGFDPSGYTLLERDRTTRQQATSKKCLLRIPETEVALDHGYWMMDLRIEHLPEFRSYSNQKAWWMLPRKRELAQMFLDKQSSRISIDYSLSVEMSRQNVFELLIPDDSSMILSALGATWQSCYSEEFKLESKKPAYENVFTSDKGDYTNGVISLLGGLQNAGYFLKNNFWRFIVEKLSKRLTSEEGEALVRIKNKLVKQKTILANIVSGQEGALEWLSRYILDLARHQPLLNKGISFPSLSGFFLEQREEFIKKNPSFRKDSSEEGIAADREQATVELSDALQAFSDRGVFLQGVNLSCKNCGSNYWQVISEVSQKNKCQGCGEMVSLSVESTWIYRLNTLLQNAVAYHGCVPVIITLHELSDFPTSHLFIYTSGIELYKSFKDDKPSAELDLACISDGKLIIGEVKTTCKEFIQKELTKLADHAKIFDADVAVLGCLHDPKNQIDQKKTNLEGLLKGTKCQVWPILPPARTFEPTSLPF